MTLVIKFQPGLRPVIKHLAGQHDQKTHGRWANSGLPHELEDIKGSLQKYFELGLLGNKNEIMRSRQKYQRNPETGESEYVTVREKTRSTLGKNYDYREPDESLDPEGYQIYQEAESKMLGGNAEEIELMARQEAIDAGMGSRQALYYGQAMVSRASLYINMENAIIMGEAVRKIYSRDVSDYEERGYREFFKTQEETVKIMGENISKSVPVIAIETDSFLGVIKDGRFKTQYEMRESNGAYKPALRREAELALSGIPLDTKASERPIYGYLAFQENGKTANTSEYNTDRWNFNNSGVGQYGEVRVVLKDEVRERTSYTSIDSLDRYGIPQPLSKTSKNDLIRSGVYQDLSASHGGYQRESYTEAQVYGGVKLSDIKAVYVTRSYDYDEKTNTYTQFDTEAQAESIRSALQAKGLDIPVKILEPEKGEE